MATTHVTFDSTPSAALSDQEHTYFALRWTIWFGGLLFLILLPVLSCTVGDRVCVQTSYSYYYHVHDWTRNVFVGFLFAIGTSLYIYKGFDRRENLLLNIAGFMAYGIALFPTARALIPSAPPLSEYERNAATLHIVAAITFFLSIAYVAVRPQPEIRHIGNTAVTRTLQFWYRIAAFGMLGGTALAVAFVFTVGRFDYRVFIAELVAISMFSLYWLTKNIEMRYTQLDETTSPNREPLPLLQELKAIGRALWPFGKAGELPRPKISLWQLWRDAERAHPSRVTRGVNRMRGTLAS